MCLVVHFWLSYVGVILFEFHLQIVVSDHGMTENGNHGGSSYEETDSLMLFIGLSSNISDYAGATNNLAFQVEQSWKIFLHLLYQSSIYLVWKEYDDNKLS